MKLGVCYYPEQWPEERWAIDAQMMVKSGLTIVRIAEFAWARMEPAAGVYDWDWLDRAVDTLAGAGLQVILGTPTATPPAWLTQHYPQMLHVDANGRRRKHGSRRQACVNNPVYREHSVRIVLAMAERYGGDARVIGWQIDNEFGGGKTGRCYCASCASGFRTWLRERYGSLNALNEAWGAEFWSQTYTEWEQIQVPDQAIDKPNASQVLDYYRFSSAGYVSYQELQLDILRAATRGFVTTNFMGLFRDLNQFDLAQPLDFVTWDNYPTGNPGRWRGLLYPPGQDVGHDDAIYAYDTGDAMIISMAHALTRALKEAPFWIMEQQCGLINWGDTNPGIRAGTTRLWTWHALVEGADTCVYFRWRPTLFAQEQYHSGLLRHDGEPAQGLRDVEALAGELELMAAIADHSLGARVALLFRYDDLWALELQEQRKGFHYLRHLYLYYMTLMKMGVAVNLVADTADFSRYDLVLAPTLHMPDVTLVEKLSRYVRQGGTLLLGVRSGFKTPTNLVTDQPLPGLLRELAGVRVTSWQSLPDGVELPLETAIPGLDGPAGYWYETLEADGATVLGSYQEVGAAITLNEVGNGRVCTLGWYPSPGQARALLQYLCKDCDIQPLAIFPDGVLGFARGPYTILLNFTDSVQTANFKGVDYHIAPRDLIVIK